MVDVHIYKLLYSFVASRVKALGFQPGDISDVLLQ